jgi:hypothetical protein
LICLRQKFYNDATQDTQWWSLPITQSPNITHWLTSLSLQQPGRI